MIASSKRSPPMRAELAYTTPFSDSTATSEVPPPMSRTMEPRGSCTGRPAPTAAAIGSLTMPTLRAPAPSADSRIARRSTCVEPKGTHTSTRGEVARSTAKHALGLGTDGDDDLAAAGGLILYRHDGRLVEDDAFVADIDQ